MQGGFPDVVPESAVNPNNTNGGLNFDTTRAAFDKKVVHEYIDWAGNRGGPLVTTENVTTRSDLRLYESDGNVTMQTLYDMGDRFLSTCVDLMGRMINTVPAGVDLAPPISPMAVKPINVTFDFDSEGGLLLTGKIRVCRQACGVKYLRERADVALLDPQLSQQQRATHKRLAACKRRQLRIRPTGA